MTAEGMEGESALLHDHSSLEGRFYLCLHRLNRIKSKYLIPPAVFIAAFAGLALLIVSQSGMHTNSGNENESIGLQLLSPENSRLMENDPTDDDDDEKTSPVPSWNIVKQPKPGVVEAEGCENGYYTFEGFDSSIPAATTKPLKIRNLVINAEKLSHSLKEWTSLESIVIENVWVNGNWSRVYLPNLKKFIYQQFRNGKTDEYKEPSILKQILFFDKSQNQTWDLTKDLLNLNMTIQVSIEGSKILDIEPDFGELNINTHNCEDLFVHFNRSAFPLNTLSLSWCPVSAISVEKLRESKDSLKYLLLNNAIPSSTLELGEITRSLRQLKELHLFQRYRCDWPGYEIFLNISDLPPTLQTLSVTNLDLSFDHPARKNNNSIPNSILNLSLDQYVGEEVVNNFPFIFPNLTSLALFNITQNRSHLLMEKVLFGSDPKPELIVVTELTRLSKSLHGRLTAPNTSNLNRKSNNNARAEAVNSAILKVELSPVSATRL